MAIDGEASSDRWADGRRRRDEVRTRHLTRELGRRLIVAVVAGLAVGIVLHVVDSAPQALVFLAVALRFLAGFGVFAGVIVGLARTAMQSRPGLLLATVALGIGALVGYPVGPTWIPGATVSGTYTLMFEGTTVPAATGALTCEWLPGRWQVGGLAAIAPVAGPGGERILLHASFAQRQVWIERTGMDGTGRAPYVDASAAVLEPPVAVTGEPQRTADGRAGTTVATLRIDVSSPPAGAPAKWSAPLAIDGAAGVEMQVTWDCAAP